MKHNSFPKPPPSHNFDLSSYDSLIRETKQNIERLKQELQAEQGNVNTSYHTALENSNVNANVNVKSLTLTEPNEHISTRTRPIINDQHEVLNDAIRSLTAENKELKTKLSTSLQQLQEVLALVQELKHQKNKLEHALHTMHSEYKADYNEVKSAVEQIERELTMNEAYVQLQRENESMKCELNEVVNENLQMKHALYASTSNSANMNELPQYDSGNNVDDNSYALHHLRKANETLLAKNVSLENDLNETKDNYMRLNTLYNEVLSENENALSKVTFLFEEINNMKVEMDKLSQQGCNSSDRLCSEMQSLSERNKELNEENKYLHNTVKEMISNNGELSKAIQQLTTQLQQVKAANAELATQNEMLHRQVELLQQQQLGQTEATH